MGGWSLVPLDLPPQHIPASPARLQNPDKTRREAEAFERLLDALASKQITLPDEAAREAVAVATADDDAANNYKEIAANHDVLLGVLGGGA